MSVMEQVKKLKSHVKLVTEQDMKNKATKYLSRFQQVLKQVNKIRLAGQGEAGFNGGPYGDLFVIINVNPSDKFTRDGSTIYYTLNISFVQAALGDTVEVPTVHGNVEMTIPAGTQTGKTFRLKGKGAPRLRGGSQGDQHVTVKIVTPYEAKRCSKEALLHSRQGKWR